MYGKNSSNESLKTWNSISDTFNCLQKLTRAIITPLSPTYACESLFSEMNNIKASLRNRFTDDSSSAGILLKLTSCIPIASKPLIEKRRRSRINKSLSELLEMVAPPGRTSENRKTRMEKAQILEMTVDYVKKLQESRLHPLEKSSTKNEFYGNPTPEGEAERVIEAYR
ncbi:dimer_Tnp_hAT domain-containing protein [Trichonephila clavipes]|nr:dimer_Tnp_hAT domain-containing protein [Trichonephila clavipes]